MIAPTRARPALPAALIALALVAPLASPAAAAGSCRRESAWADVKGTWASEVLALTNAHRATLGLSQLAPSASLTSAATWKAAHMAGFEYMAHDDPAPPVARTWDQRIRDCGYSSGAGENIAYGYRTPQAVFQGWLDSSGHRRNIENPSYKVVGVGAAVNSGGTPYWAQVFGLRVEAGDGLQVPTTSPTPSPSPSPTPSPAPSPSPTPSPLPAPSPAPTDPAVDVPPVARDVVVSVPEDGRATVVPPAAGSGAVAVVADPAHGTATPAGTEVVYVPDADFNGTDSFSYSSIDSTHSTSTGTVTVRVEPRNDAPRAGRDRRRARPRKAVVIRVLVNDLDVDGDRLVLRGIVRPPYYGSAKVDRSTGSIQYRPRRGTGGRFDRMTYKVSDGNGGTDVATVDLKIAR